MFSIGARGYCMKKPGPPPIRDSCRGAVKLRNLGEDTYVGKTRTREVLSWHKASQAHPFHNGLEPFFSFLHSPGLINYWLLPILIITGQLHWLWFAANNKPPLPLRLLIVVSKFPLNLSKPGMHPSTSSDNRLSYINISRNYPVIMTRGEELSWHWN